MIFIKPKLFASCTCLTLPRITCSNFPLITNKDGDDNNHHHHHLQSCILQFSCCSRTPLRCARLHREDGGFELGLDGRPRGGHDEIVPNGAWAAGAVAFSVELEERVGVVVQLAHLLQAAELLRLHQQAAAPVLPPYELLLCKISSKEKKRVTWWVHYKVIVFQFRLTGRERERED